MALFLCFLFLLISSATACDRCVHQSQAKYTQDSALLTGACGYGSLASGLNDYLAGGISSLYNNGAGCGTCFQIRCKNSYLCSTKGVKVTLVNQHYEPQTDFILSNKSFMAMANPGMASDLLKLEIVDVEYKRIPCEYNQNLAVRVEESSNKYYLQIKLLYQGGQTEIVLVDVAQVGSSNWISMSRNYGAVWDTNSVPTGALKFRFLVTSGYDGKWIYGKSLVLAGWENGDVYDMGVQITDIAQESCYPCDYSKWI